MTKASDFKFGTQLGFAKAHYKITPIGKVDVALGYGSSQKFRGSPLIFVQQLKLATSNLACNFGWPRPTIKTTTRGKIVRGLGLGKLPYIWGSLLIFL